MKMRDWIPAILVFALLLVIEVFSKITALWIASVLLAGCLGILWGAGDQIRKHRDGDPS
jgi:hypothetical protein